MQVKQGILLSIISCWVGCLLGITAVQAQDPVYSQYFSAPLQLNPALTGLVEAPVLTLNYRNQWPNIPDAYATYAASVSHYFANIHSGFGLLVEADVAGQNAQAKYRAGLFYAYDIRFNKNFYIRAGLELNAVNVRLDWNKLVFLDQLTAGASTPSPNSQELQGNPTTTYLDIGTVLLLHTPYFYAGLSLQHINSPRVALTTNSLDGSDVWPLRYNIHAGSKINLRKPRMRGPKSFLSPTALFLQQGAFRQLNLGTHLQHGIILGGIWFRHTFSNADAVIVLLGIQTGMFKIAYSYDITVSALNVATGGAHEIALTFNWWHKKQNNRNRYNDCLEIFR
jgi:type IX secretion system PorP/SprF family membrane protein